MTPIARASGAVLAVVAAAAVLAGCRTEGTGSPLPCRDPSQSIPCKGVDDTWIGLGGTTSTSRTPTSRTPSSTPSTARSASTADFTIELEVTDKQCFGSAGCSVTVVPKLTYLGSGQPSGQLRITYEISGGEDGVTVKSINADNGGYRQTPTTVGTPSSKTVLSARITGVS